MKKQLPGWAVLLIITLVAGLALGGTNALTKDPIAQQALIKAENARKAALPDAASFEEIPLAEGASVDWVYAGLKDGSPAGYVAQKTVNGFGGKVEVIAGVDTKDAPDTFKIGGITVGGADFSETAGLGARAKEPAFTNQFPGKVYPVSYIKAGGTPTESTVDALTSATITTTAVVNGVNDIVKYVKADVMGIAGVEMPAKPADGVFSASEKGFRGPVYVEAAFDAAGKVTYIKVGDESFAEDIGVGVIEPDFMIQFIGKQMPLEVSDIDVIAGATISSTAVVKALNNAYAIAGGAEIVVPETPTMPEKPAEGVYSASADGFRGPVYVEAAFDSDAKVTYISVGDEAFAEDVGAGVKEPEFMIQFIGKTVPLEVSDIDAIAGATISSTAVVNALNKAYNASQGIVEEVVEIVMPEKPAEGVFSAAEKGFAGPVYTEAAFDADGKITYIAVGDDSFAETEGFGARALVPENLYPFIGAQMPLNVEDVDALSGATSTKTAIVNSLNKAYAASKGEVIEESVKEETPAVAETAENTFGADADGFQSPVHVEAAFDGDKVTSMTIGDKRFDETPGFGARALEPEVAAAFIGKTVPMKVEDIDVLTGATFTKTAVVEALNKAYEKSLTAAPAEEKAAGYVASTQGFGGPVTVEATFDGDKIAAIKIGDDQFAETPGLGARALEDEFQAQFIGKQMPISLSDIDAIAGATVTSTAVVDALNAAYAQVETAAVPAAEPAAEPETAAAEGLTLTAEITSGNEVLTLEATVEDGKITALKVTPAEKEALLQEKFVGAELPLNVVEDDINLFSAAVALNKAWDEIPTEPSAAEILLASDAGAVCETTASGKEIQVRVNTANDVVAGLVVLDKPAGSSQAFDISERDAEMKDLFLAKTLPLDPDAQDSSYAAAVAAAINEASGVEGASKEENAFVKAEKVLAKNFGKTAETALDGKELQVRVTSANGVVAGLVVLEKAQGAEEYKLSALDADMKNLFLAQTLPLDVNGQSTVAAAAVANAVNTACGFEAQKITVKEEAPAETTAAPEQQEAAAETSAASELTLRVTAEFENDTLTSLTVLEKTDSGEFVPCAQEYALKEKFLGQPLPLDINQSSALEATAAIAINKAYYNQVHEAEPRQAEVSDEEPVFLGEAISFFTSIRAKVQVTPARTVEAVEFEEKPVGAEEYHPSDRNDALEALFVGEALPLDVKLFDDAYQAAAAVAVNAAFAQYAESGAYTLSSAAYGVGESISFFTMYKVSATFDNGTIVTFGGFKEPVGGGKAPEILDCDALNELFAGQPMPLNAADYTAVGIPEYEMTAIVIALNQAYENSLAGQ